MIVDVHCGWGPSLAAPNWNSAETVRSTLQARGIGMAFVASTLARRYDPVAGNDVIADAVAGEDDGCDLRGWVVASPAQVEEAGAQMRTLLRNDRFVGLALYPDPLTGRPVTLDSARELCTVFRRYSRPLLIEALEEEAMAEALEIAHALNGMKVIVSGMGGSGWRRSIDRAARHVNVFLDISGALVPEKILHAVRVIGGVRKLLFASGAPGTDPAAVLAMLDETGLGEEEKERILSGNALRLFGFRSGEDEAPVSLSPLGGS